MANVTKTESTGDIPVAFRNGFENTATAGKMRQTSREAVGSDEFIAAECNLAPPAERT